MNDKGLELKIKKLDMLGFKHRIIDGCLVYTNDKGIVNIYLPDDVIHIGDILKGEGFVGDVYVFGPARLRTFNLSGCEKLERITLDIDTTMCTSAEDMFKGCHKLEVINFKRFNSSRIKSMARMFMGCNKLKKVNVEILDTSNCTNMLEMFYNCSELEQLNLSNFDTSNVENMAYMFSKCTKLSNIDVRHFDTKMVILINGMFNECDSITDIDISHFDTRYIGSYKELFRLCSNLKRVDISGINTYYAYSFESMFSDCKSLEEIVGINDIDTTHMLNLGSTFNSCSSLVNLDLSHWVIKGGANLRNTFSRCTYLETLDIRGFDIKNAKSTDSTFKLCVAVKELHIGNFFDPWLKSKTNRSLLGSYALEKVVIHCNAMDFDTFKHWVQDTFDKSNDMNDGGEQRKLNIELDSCGERKLDDSYSTCWCYI